MERKQRKIQIDKEYINTNLKRFTILYFVISTAAILIKTIIEIILKKDPSILAITKIIGQNINSAITTWIPFCVLPLAIIVLVICIVFKPKILACKEKKIRKQKQGESNRDKSIDVLRGLFIIAMIVGHFGIDNALIKIIYSCHMAAFVVVSGYFFNKEKTFKDTLKSSAKTLLIPYAVFAIIQILINIPNWSGEFFFEALKKYTSGVILTKNILTSVQSIGPAWFVLMLFVVRILYTLIQKICKKEWIVTIVVIVLSIVGVVIGKAGYWLAWSFDIALYSLIFYHAGHLFKKFNVLEYMKQHIVLYFALTPVWAYMIIKGSVELSRRNYGSYAVAIIGALAGILATYILSTLLVNASQAFSNIIATLGQASMYILLIHTLLDEILRMQLIKIIPQGNIAVMLITMLIELAISYMVYKLIEMIKKKRLCAAPKN